MKITRIFLPIIYSLITSISISGNEDTICNRKKSYFLELRGGAIYQANANGKNENAQGKISEFLLFGAGREFKNSRLVLHLEYAKFSLIGSSKTVGTSSFDKVTQSQVEHLYNIRQSLSFYSMSFNLSYDFYYNINKKTSIAIGPKTCFVFLRSKLTILNQYVGDQPQYLNHQLPKDNQSFQDQHRYNKGIIPHFGINVNLLYTINSKLRAGLNNSFNYDANMSLTGNSYGALPKQNIYTFNKLFWLTAGLSIVTLF